MRHEICRQTNQNSGNSLPVNRGMLDQYRKRVSAKSVICILYAVIITQKNQANIEIITTYFYVEIVICGLKFDLD